MTARQIIFCVKCYQKQNHVKPFYSSWRHFTSRKNVIEAKEVRSTFLDFFCQQNGHTYVRPSSVIPGKDQGVYFTNAGMNQFKPVFLGTVPAGSEMASWKRAANSQKCVRVGGKHNDLADVGADLTHHTFFEMLGSWSFGDYFKLEACQMALELLQQVYRLPLDRLYFTYFGGDSNLGLEPDLETRELWRQLGVPASRVLAFGMGDNFWDMGDTGPCGPCTEIHYDHVGGRDASRLVNTGSQEVVEIWNLVFMQYDRQGGGNLVPLPHQHVDTGMGLERLCAVVQGTRSNYNTSLFWPIFKVIQQETGALAYSDMTGCQDTAGLNMAYRILADHVRMASVCISDGLLPGRELLEQRLRSVIYRALYQSRHVLKAPEGLMSRLVDPVVDSLGEVFPEISLNASKVKHVLLETEQRYIQSERDGDRNLNKLLKKHPGIDRLEDEQIRQLNTGFYGDSISLEMIELVARLQNISVDDEAITAIMEESKVFPTTEVVYPWPTQDLVKQLASAGVPLTQDEHKYQYVRQGDSYKFEQLTGQLVYLLDSDNSVVDVAASGSRLGLVLDRSMFYAEKGGQAGDVGTIKTQTGMVAVTDTQSSEGYVIHIGMVTEGTILAGQQVAMEIDPAHRVGCMRNHTCTHLLGAALKTVLGPDTSQQGSSITSAKFTFSFSHVGTITGNQLEAVESLVRETIHAQLPVQRQLMKLREAQSKPGLVYLDNVVYPSDVYVVSLEYPPCSQNVLQSAELCGGTHVLSTGDLVEFCITGLTGLGSGTKTITCLTGPEAKQAMENGRDLEAAFEELAEIVNSGADVALCQAKQKSVHKMLHELLVPRTVRDRVAQSLDQLGTTINTAAGKQVTAELKQDLQTKLNGPEPYLVYEMAAKTMSKVMKIVKSLEAPKPCVIVVLTNKSTSAVILFPKTLQTDRVGVVGSFVEATGGKVKTEETQFVLVSGARQDMELFVKAAKTVLDKYSSSRTESTAGELS